MVCGGPYRVTHTLEAEHGVVNVEGQHGQAMNAVAGGRGRPTGNRTSFADAFLQNLAVHGFAVTQHRANVFGLVLLPHAGINPHLLEQIRHAKGTRLISHDRDDACAKLRVLHEIAQQAHKGHGGRHLFAIGLDSEVRVAADGWHRNGVASGFTLGQVASQLVTPRMQVLHLWAVVFRFEKRQFFGLLVAQRQIEAVAKL